MDNSIDISKMYGITGNAPDNYGFQSVNPYVSNVTMDNCAKPMQKQNLDTRDSFQSITPITVTNEFMYNNLTDKHENLQAIRAYNQPFPITPESMQYLNGFLRTQIGRRVEVQFLIGNNIEIKSGFLLGVGANYILLNDADSDDLTSCDFYNIKFIRFFY